MVIENQGQACLLSGRSAALSGHNPEVSFVNLKVRIFFVGTRIAPACFHGFSCCDASLRHEGCFFSVAGLPKFASEQAGYGEETTGVALASQQGFYWFLLQ